MTRKKLNENQTEQTAFHRIVLKLGTSTLTAGTPRLSSPHLVELARQVAAIRSTGGEVIIVSSGAIAAGRERLNFKQLPKGLPAKQMLAAIGQPRLMALYEQIFGLYGLVVAQVLLTRADLENRRRYLNSRNTLMALIAQDVIPIINENDTVATEEIRVGENDNLSAMVSNLIEADLLVLLTDQAGLYTADPRRDLQARLVNLVEGPEIPTELWQMAGGSASGLGTGGMLTKLQAADLARRGGATVVIAQGSDLTILSRLIAGEYSGTRFMPSGTALDSRKRYLLAGGPPAGSLIVDEGAVRALRRGNSLLPVGVLAVEGEFERGDPVLVVGPGQKSDLPNRPDIPIRSRMYPSAISPAAWSIIRQATFAASWACSLTRSNPPWGSYTPKRLSTGITW